MINEIWREREREKEEKIEAIVKYIFFINNIIIITQFVVVIVACFYISFL